MNINPHDEALKCIKSIEKRLTGYMLEETKLKQCAANVDKPSDKNLVYNRLKRVQDAIFKHQVYLFAAYSKLQSIEQPQQNASAPEPDAKPFGIGEVTPIDVPTP